MGRTNPTFRLLLEGLEDRWQPYRRALRRRDQDHFDGLWADAVNHADAAGYLNHDDPMVPVLFSMLLAQRRRVVELEAAVDGAVAVGGTGTESDAGVDEG